MTEIRATTGTLAGQAATRGRGLTITLWVLQAVLAFGFISGGVLKLSGSPVMVELFADIGAGQWLRYVVGVLELAGGVGVLIPRLSGLAALGLVALMAGASITNVFILGIAAWVPLAYLVLSAVVAWGRRPETNSLLGTLRH